MAAFQILHVPKLLLLLLLLLSQATRVRCAEAPASSYSNITLSSLDGDLNIVVYLPAGLKPDEPAYYRSTRFDHGSMIGNIHYKKHSLFGADTWRRPHNGNWPESGVGLASEFGVGDDGDFCYFQCGWARVNDVTNGLLGYQQAKIGESFLKLGVGELVKGTCPTCDSTEDYKFNSPYLFARQPEWKIVLMGADSVSLEHSAKLHGKGYKLQKDVQLTNNVLSIKSTLTNLGNEAFATAWYSHNFFTCDDEPIGPGYSATFAIKGTDHQPLYQEPGTWSWSTPLEQFGKVTGRLTTIALKMVRTLDPGVRIKTEFENDGSTKGAFSLEGCNMRIESKILEVETGSVPMYAYNLYVERDTLSPEPQILIRLQPGQTTSWTQQLLISAIEEEERMEPSLLSSTLRLGSLSQSATKALDHPSGVLLVQIVGLLMMITSATLVVLWIQKLLQARRRCRDTYTRIPDSTLQG
jgi:hypothetical protein